MYSLGDYAAMYVSSFVVVFLLGLQSKNVNRSRYVAAALTSIGISLSQFVFVKYAANGSYFVLFVMALGGAMGIVTSIYVHDHHIERWFGKHS